MQYLKYTHLNTFIDDDPIEHAQLLLAQYPNRPQNNDDYKSDLSIVPSAIDVYAKYRNYYQD